VSDLDADLRALLRERASEITQLPPALLESADGRHLVVPRRQSLRRPGWSIAAAVACVLIVVGVATALGRHVPSTRHENRAARSASPQPTSRTSPPTPAVQLPHSLPVTAHPARHVALTSIPLRNLPGYVIHQRTSAPGYRSVAVRARVDTGVPVGCNGCESATAYVDVFDKGRFDPTHYGLSSWAPTTVRGRAAYRGRMPWLAASGHQVPTLAWQFAAGRWALVQGVTTYGATTPVLTSIAAAVDPNAAAPVNVPFRLTWAPDLPVTGFSDDRSEGYALTVTLGHNDGTSYHDPQIDFALWPNDPHSVAHTPDHRVSINRVTGWYDRARGVADIATTGGTLEIGVTDTGALSAADRVILDRVLAGLRILSDGAQSPAEHAFP
jgi:hypothetical protein